MVETFTARTFRTICDELAARDRALRFIRDTFGYPPMWTRPNTFESLVHIILEQQVSLASARAALNKPRERLPKITPAALLELDDEELKACYFSRQKMGYVRSLAESIRGRRFSLAAMETLSNDEIREKMISLKGFGHWTIDVYLMFVLRRADIFPAGDLAAVNALKKVKKFSKDVERAKLIRAAARWKPYRTVATMMLWHFYLSIRVKGKSTEATKIKKAIII